MFGERTCSHCHGTFKARTFGINLLVKRYEICPFCHKFTEVHYLLPAAPEGAQEDGDRQPLSEEEALRKRIDESKYEGH